VSLPRVLRQSFLIPSTFFEKATFLESDRCFLFVQTLTHLLFSPLKGTPELRVGAPFPHSPLTWEEVSLRSLAKFLVSLMISVMGEQQISRLHLLQPRNLTPVDLPHSTQAVLPPNFVPVGPFPPNLPNPFVETTLFGRSARQTPFPGLPLPVSDFLPIFLPSPSSPLRLSSLSSDGLTELASSNSQFRPASHLFFHFVVASFRPVSFSCICPSPCFSPLTPCSPFCPCPPVTFPPPVPSGRRDVPSCVNTYVL